MKATVKIKDLKYSEGKHMIVRNLSRIMDIRILDINVESRTISLIYDSDLAFEKVKSELRRIGYPIVKCTYQPPAKRFVLSDYKDVRLQA